MLPAHLNLTHPETSNLMKKPKNISNPSEEPEPAPPAKPSESSQPDVIAKPDDLHSSGKENTPAEEPETAGTGQSVPEAPHPAKPSLFRRFTHWLFGADSPVGRVVRMVLRAIAIGLVLIAAGMLAFYFLFFRPQANVLDSANQTLLQRDSTITTLEGKNATVQSDLSSAQKQVSGLKDELKTAQNQNKLLVLLNDVAVARMELALKDGARTLESIEKARKDLDAVYAFVNEKDPKAAAEIKSRLELMSSVLVRDAALAKSDMDNLYTALLAIYDQLFK